MQQDFNLYYILLFLLSHSELSAFDGPLKFQHHQRKRRISFLPIALVSRFQQPSAPGTRDDQRSENTPLRKMPYYSSERRYSLRSTSIALRDEFEGVQRMGNRTQVRCDDLLARCIAHDEWDLVLEVMELMKESGYSQEKSTYTASLKACRTARNPGSAAEMLSAMKLASFDPTVEDYAITIDTLCCDPNNSYWGKALQIQQEAASKSDQEDLPIETYERLVHVLCRRQEWREVVRLVRFMECHDQMNATRPSLVIYQNAIECCVSCRQVDLASQILQSSKLVPTTQMFETVIVALCQQLQWRRAMILLNHMEQLGVSRNLHIYNALLTSCGRSKEGSQAKSLLVRMRRHDMIQPNIASFNSVMSACVGAHQWKDALSILDQAHREPGVTPDLYTYTNAIRACAKGRQTSRALTLLQVVKDKGLGMDSYCYTAAMEACDWREALALLLEMEENGISPTEVTYSVAIKACGKGGQWEKSLELLNEMRTKGMTPNLYVYNAALTSIAKASKRLNKGRKTTGGKMYKKLQKLLQQMREDNIDPDGFSYSSAISCCGSEGMWKEAMGMINWMQKGGPKMLPNKVAYTAAITSCAKANQPNDAIDLFEKMKDQGLCPDTVAYNAMFAALRTGRLADEAFALWDEMMGRTTKTTMTTAYKVHPDIITLTDAIGAMASDENCTRMDKVFREAVDLGLILNGNNLDSSSEFDLSGLSIPVARSACRFIIFSLLDGKKRDEIEDLVFITGVGSHHRQGSTNTTSLRDYLQEILISDFCPSLNSSVPLRAKGTVVVGRKDISSWIRHNSVITH